MTFFGHGIVIIPKPPIFLSQKNWMYISKIIYSTSGFGQKVPLQGSLGIAQDGTIHPDHHVSSSGPGSKAALGVFEVGAKVEACRMVKNMDDPYGTSNKTRMVQFLGSGFLQMSVFRFLRHTY